MTTVRRCIACGGFFDAQECPNDHSNIEGFMPAVPIVARYKELRGRVVSFPWPSSGEIVTGVLTDNEDTEGLVGVMVLNPSIRVSVDDLKEIP